MPWQDGSPRRARQRAGAALRANPWRSDQLIARQARCGSTTAAAARRQLEDAGLIPPVPVSRRERQPYPRQQSATHAAIIGGARTPRQVADVAGVSMQAAHKALQRHREREPIPRPPPPPSGCEHCGRVYVPAPRPGGRPQRYCSDPCAGAARNARRRAVRAAGRLAAPPQIRQMPPIPDAVILGGLCVQPGARYWLWASDDPADREQARRICKVCSVQLVCLAWSLEAIPPGDSAIYAGEGKAGRRRLRQQLTAYLRPYAGRSRTQAAVRGKTSAWGRAGRGQGGRAARGASRGMPLRARACVRAHTRARVALRPAGTVLA